MNTIETEVWKPADKPGFITFDRCKTILDWANEVEAGFKALTPENKYGCGRFEWFGLGGLEYGTIRNWTKHSEFPRHARLVCHCEQGTSEGYIVNVTLLPEDGPALVLLCGKCFEMDYAWQATRQLSELLGIMPQSGQPIAYARCIIFPKETAPTT